ncbi:MAG: CPBP family intramembrane metalloprotease [Candidatus Bathyarchaeota archaeon]|nr:MAG: CPBP family intramembrane metalloprotease [Candidatus Bathyarchaeota archaeon]
MTNPTEQEKVAAVSTIEAVLVIVITFFMVLSFGFLFFRILGPGLALIFSELIILILPLGYLLFKGVDIKRYVRLDVSPKLIMLGFVSGAILLFVNVVVSLVLLTIFGESQAVIESNTMITELSASPSGLIAVTTALGLAGVCEEFAFRGFLQSTLTRRFSFVPAVLISAFAFGIFHFDPQLVYILSALSAGLVLGYVYHRWNSYIVAVIAHSSVNLLVLAILLLGY